MSNKCFFRLFALCVCAFIFSTCATTVTRTDKLSDLNGDWNDNDVQKACNTLIADFVADSRVERYINDFGSKHKGEPPAVIVLTFKNASDEHIDTKIITNKMRNSIVKSDRLAFVESGASRDAIRAERSDQNNYNASESSAAKLGAELGANLSLTGDVRSIRTTEGNKQTRSYYINASITNIESNRILWTGEAEIKKAVKRSSAKA